MSIHVLLLVLAEIIPLRRGNWIHDCRGVPFLILRGALMPIDLIQFHHVIWIWRE